MKPPRRMATGTRMTTDMIMRMTTRPTDTPATTIRPTDSPAMFMARVADMTMPTTTGTHTTRAIVTATATSMAENGALPLFVWLSPAFPVGAFAYSHGLEWAVESGQVNDAAGAQAWIYDLLREGSGRNDAILLAAAHRAVMAGDEKALTEVAELAVALQPSRERHLESTSQGNAFITAARATWPSPGLDALGQGWGDDVCYPVAVGVAAAGHCIALRETLEAFLLAFVANLVSAVVRLGPIGQTDGQRITAALLPAVREVAASTEHSTTEDLGGAAFRSDIASLRHETQYSRLFRS